MREPGSSKGLPPAPAPSSSLSHPPVARLLRAHRSARPSPLGGTGALVSAFFAGLVAGNATLGARAGHAWDWSQSQDEAGPAGAVRRGDDWHAMLQYGHAPLCLILQR